MNARLRMVPWLIILVPFVVLACAYTSLPDQIVVARSFLGAEAILAPKTPFTVFRVPLIEVVCAAAIEIMRRAAAREGNDQDRFWTILLYTVAFKSLLQALEVIVPDDFKLAVYYLTAALVIGGILAAAIFGRRIFSNLWTFRSGLGRRDIAALGFLLVAYLGLAWLPMVMRD